MSGKDVFQQGEPVVLDERLAGAEEIARVGCWEFDHQRGRLTWSHELYGILELDPAITSPSREALLRHVHPGDRAHVDDVFRGAMESGGSFCIRHRLSLADNRTVWLETRCETSYGAQGHPETTRCMVRDMTAVIEANDALQRSETLASSILRFSPEAVIVTDQFGHVVAFSDGAEKMFRCGREQVLGTQIEQFMPERFRSRHRQHVETFLASSQLALRMGDRSEIRARRFTGEEFAAEATVSKAPTGREGLLIVILRDLSERKAYEAALESAKIRAEAANEAKSAFLATMSHEIRTPMNGVLGMLAVLAMDDLNPQQREMVEVAIDAGHSLMDLLNDVLDYSRIEAGQIRLELTQFEIREVLRKVQTLHSFKAHASGIDLQVSVAPDVPQLLLGDPARLQQILHNLVGNAVKFTHRGSVDLRAEFAGSEGGDPILTISVADTGIGMNKDKLAIVFDRFVQADSSITRQFGGSGLGLSIVKALVEAMGGRIDVRSEPGTGSCFTIQLPAGLPSAIASGEHKTVRSLQSGLSPKPVRVLVAEDNVLNARTIRLLLDRQGTVVSIAGNGEEALKLFEPGRFDLVIMDIQMPVLDGESAIKVIRKLEAASSQPAALAVACTAHHDHENHERYRHAGFDHAISKPIDPQEIARLVGLAVARISG